MNRLFLFPDTTKVEGDGLSIGGCDLAALAETFGTPLYVYDRATLDRAAAAYRQALAEAYPAPSGLTYAGKAFLCRALAEWVGRQGLWLDCTGRGEMAIALAAGLPPEQILVHGVNKSAADLEMACRHAGVIVVDNLSEVARLLCRPRPLPRLWLRFRPEVSVETHAHIQTGQPESKFGMGEAEIIQAAGLFRRSGLPLAGLHFHLGSQLRDPRPVAEAIGRTLALACRLGVSEGWTLSPGGGWGVAYHEDDLPQPDLAAYVGAVAAAVVEGCRRFGLPLPRLQLEPGRSLVARAGVAVYRVETVKQAAGRRWLLLDGGLADNPRPALYAARYSALPVRGVDRPAAGPAWFAGPYCESGDVLIAGLPFPEVEEGEWVALPVSGAYQLSMASNYNGACRPAVVWLEGGRARLIQRRETPEDLLRRDLAAEGKDLF
ncbi:MAG: diaminopimelate decarboxylase [Anaerolineales bacterium]